MIIIDYSGLCLNNIFSYFLNNPDASEEKDDNLLRHIILNSFLNVKLKFGRKYGDITIAIDSRQKYWRKIYFPNYKIKRKPAENKVFDFVWCKKFLDSMVEDLKAYTHYHIIEESGAEADDVVAVLTKKFIEKEDVLIVSKDSDFFQLQKYNATSDHKVVQVKYDLTSFLKADDAEEYIIDKVIRGDSGDSIPNILSDDNVFKEHRRQVVMSKKRYLAIREADKEVLTEEVLKNWKRNNKLINFDAIPKQLQENIWNNYNLYVPQPKYKFISYLQKYDLDMLLKEFNNF